MLRLGFVWLLLATLLFSQEKKRKLKPPEVEISSVAIRRDVDAITLDGRVRNTGERPAVGIVLSFHFFAPGRQPLTTQKGALDADSLEPGEEREFRFQVQSPPRAIEVTIEAIDGQHRDLKVIKPGPYRIE